MGISAYRDVPPQQELMMVLNKGKGLHVPFIKSISAWWQLQMTKDAKENKDEAKHWAVIVIVNS